jgi:group I intron endonuclease
MESYQYTIRKNKSLVETIDFDINDVSLNNCTIKQINKQTATNIILEYEWLHTMPYICLYQFGLFFKIGNKEVLGGVLVFSTEYAENTGVWLNYGFEDKILLLSRGVCLWWTPKNSASYFISRACKWIKNNTKYRIITATVDPSAGEIGTIYQSLNWYYVGLMSGNYLKDKKIKRFAVIINKKLRYSRWIRKNIGTMKREEILKKYPDVIFVPQYRKRRYFYFMDNKYKNNQYLNSVKHLILPYPKRNDDIVGIVYKITNKFNNKIYIGQTTRSLNSRISKYKKGLTNPYFSNSIKKYGWDSFEIEVIDTANNIDELNFKEIKYILEYKSTDSEYGYNIESGGNNSIVSDSTKDKMSTSHKGIKQSDEWINNRIYKKGSEDAKKYGKPKTEEERIELSKKSPKFWQNKKRSEETKLKMSETKKRNGLSTKSIESICKSVYVYNIQTNELINKFISVSEAAKYFNVSQATISRYCGKDKIKDGMRFSYN